EGKVVQGRNICSFEQIIKINNSTEIELEKWMGNVEGKIWQIIDPFMSIYTRLKIWIDNNKRIPSCNNDDIKEEQLGTWCNNQRVNKRNNKLNENRIELL